MGISLSEIFSKYIHKSLFSQGETTIEELLHVQKPTESNFKSSNDAFEKPINKNTRDTKNRDDLRILVFYLR